MLLILFFSHRVQHSRIQPWHEKTINLLGNYNSGIWYRKRHHINEWTQKTTNTSGFKNKNKMDCESSQLKMIFAQ